MVIAQKYSPHFQTTQLISYLPTPPIISAKSLGDSKIPGHPKRTTRSGVFNGWKYVSKSSSLLAAFTLWPAHKLCLIWISRIVWHYDSSGVQARTYFGSLYEPILFCVKNPKSYTFNATEIEVETRTGA